MAHFLKNAERKEHISIPNADDQIEGVHTAWRRQKEGQSQDIEGINQGRGTHSLERPPRRRQLRIQKESDWARGTHILETTEGGTSQDMKRKQPNEEHSLS